MTFFNMIFNMKCRSIAGIVLCALACAVTPVHATMQMRQAADLDELLKLVQQARLKYSNENSQREATFRQKRQEQQRLLGEAKAAKKQQEARSDRLEAAYQANEIQIGNLQDALDQRLGSLRELFGVLQQVSGDMRGQFQGSLVSAEYPGRGAWLSEFAAKMGSSSKLASIAEMRRLWSEIQREMTETGRVSKFQGTVIMSDGEQVQTSIIRVGAFNLVADGRYVNYEPEQEAIVEIPQQPSARFSRTASDIANTGPDKFVQFGIDPTRGSLLNLLSQAATFSERVGTPFGGITGGQCYLPFSDGQGGCTGAIIILAGIVGVLLAIERLITLTLTGLAVAKQKSSDEVDTTNPLGRVLNVYEENREVDVETLELKLAEAVLGETPQLTRNITLIQVISVVSPLMGLLGTVIGMIITFQAITLFGTGDPKTMAGGISTALMTTVLGLVVAIPTTLMHALVSAQSRAIVHILEEQTAGLTAERAERIGKALA